MGILGGKMEKRMTIEEFFKIEDKDLRKFIHITGRVNSAEISMSKIDNDEKISYYKIQKNLRMSSKGEFFAKNSLLEWIYYDKKTKKARISKGHSTVYNSLMEDSFLPKNLLHVCVPRLTPTLCKKIIEKKINTMEDIARYHRSYTVRNKNLSLEAVYKFMVSGMLWAINFIEDPENITVDSCKLLNHLDTSTVLSNRIYKLKVSELGTEKVRDVYNEWINEQSEKYAKITGQRITKNGNLPF